LYLGLDGGATGFATVLGIQAALAALTVVGSRVLPAV
jgi:hypothetical protein